MTFRCLVLSFLSVISAAAQDARTDPSKISTSGKYQIAPSGGGLTQQDKRALALTVLGPGKFQIGQVKIDQKEKHIRFPATFEVTDDNLEYALVHSRGKIHESLLITDVLPAQLHYAVQLLKPKKKSPLEITICWSTHGPKKSLSLSQLIQITDRASTSKPRWYYQAHLLADGSLAAQSEYSLISLIRDPAALIHHEAADKLNRDDIYLASAKQRLPKKGLPVEIVIHLSHS